MKTVKVESLKEHRYGGVRRPVGAVYEAEERYLRTITMIGWAKVLPDDTPKPANPRNYKRRDMKAED